MDEETQRIEVIPVAIKGPLDPMFIRTDVRSVETNTVSRSERFRTITLK